MSKIVKAKAYTNGQIAYIGWQVSSMIPGCLGFTITRIMPDDTTQNKFLASWVPFKGQSNPDWKPQDTSVWPIQKLSWRDLTLIKSRDSLNTRQIGFEVQYLIRPVVAYRDGLQEITTQLPQNYTGDPVRLAYLDEGLTTNIIKVTTQYGDVRATFNNGILATQWLANVLKEQHADIKNLIAQQGGMVRTYLTGEVLGAITGFIKRLEGNAGATLKLALYEFDDDELKDALMSVKDRIEIVLSNTSKNKDTKKWDGENQPFRQEFHDAGVNIIDRFFNNPQHIGHNKFMIYLENGIPKAVLGGSTNWTPNGLCAQSNNAVIIDSQELATCYNNYFEALKKDTESFTVPDPTSDATKNAQGRAFRSLNSGGNTPISLPDGTTLTVWFSPNTIKTTVDKEKMPPDLSAVYSLMRKAKDAIFFAVFLPGLSNNAGQTDIMTNIITEAIDIGGKDESVLVYGAISSPMAMPNYQPNKKTGDNDNSDDDSSDTDEPKKMQPATYDTNNVHIVRAMNITTQDKIGDFEAELLSLGFAIIHNKLIVIDPFSDNPVAVVASHNLGFKASYGNDENLIIIENNPALVRSYAVHILDIYEHYRFRAVQAELHDQRKTEWDGFLSLGDGWLEYAMSASGKGSLANYMVS